MMPAALSQIVPVQPARDAPGREQAEQRAAFSQLEVGRLLTGTVVGRHRDLTLIRIEQHTVALRLAQPPKTGAQIRLSFAGFSPEPVFQLEAPDSRTSSLPQISQTARQLADLMRDLPRTPAQAPAPTTPLLPESGMASAQIATALLDAITRSGLFYESHLARWLAGRDTLEGLRKEPQNLQPEPRSVSDSAGTPNRVAPIVAQQLLALESPALMWRGEVWPGQVMHWEVAKEHPDHPHPKEAAPPADAAWISHIRLEWPKLGEMAAELRIDGDGQLSLRITPTRSDTLSALTAAQASLVSRLAAAGLQPGRVEIRDDAAK